MIFQYLIHQIYKPRISIFFKKNDISSSEYMYGGSATHVFNMW
jgi:hypothetical protein